jgi:hypothetical protein
LLKNEQALRRVAARKQTLHHVVCVLMDDQFSQFILEGCEDEIDIFLRGMGQEGLEVT